MYNPVLDTYCKYLYMKTHTRANTNILMLNKKSLRQKSMLFNKILTFILLIFLYVCVTIPKIINSYTNNHLSLHLYTYKYK